MKRQLSDAADEDASEDDNDLDLDTISRTKSGGKGKKEEMEDYSSGEDSHHEEELDLPESEGEFSLNYKTENEPPMEPFNLRDEMQEGYFDKETGSYVQRIEGEGKEESFLEGYTQEEMEKARMAHERRLKEEESKRKSVSAEEISQKSILSDLITFLKLGETCIEAIQRRGNKDGAKRYDARSKREEAARMKNDPDYRTRMEVSKKEIERITEFCGQLMDMGISDIYDLTREEIQRHAQRLQ